MIASDYASMYRHERCQHRTPSGRQCSAVVTDQRYHYCPNHVPVQPNDSEDLSTPLTEHAGQFLNAQGINYSLSALYHLLASGKISPRRATTLAYISSLLLHSLKAIDNDPHPTAGFEEKPAKVYASEAQWALAMMTPPIVPTPTSTRIYPDLPESEELPPTSTADVISAAHPPTFEAALQQASTAEIEPPQIANAAANSASAIPPSSASNFLAHQLPPDMRLEGSKSTKTGAIIQNRLSSSQPFVEAHIGQNSCVSSAERPHVEPSLGSAGQDSAPLHHPAGHGVLSSAGRPAESPLIGNSA